MADRLERFPLFPLGIVLLPHELLPLHVFEQRYRRMIDDCLNDEPEFGVVWLADDGLREVGCTAIITQLLERAEDGRMNIVVEGTRPFKLLRRIDDMPYPAGAIELLSDASADVDEDVLADTRGRYAEVVARATDARPSETVLEQLDAYAMAATIEFVPEAKQQLLELRSEEDRLRLLGELCATTMKRLDYVERAGERARSNGKVRLQ